MFLLAYFHQWPVFMHLWFNFGGPLFNWILEVESIFLSADGEVPVLEL